MSAKQMLMDRMMERNDKLLTVIIDEFINDRASWSNEDLMDALYNDKLNDSNVILVDVYADWHLPYLYSTIKDMYTRVKDI